MSAVTTEGILRGSRLSVTASRRRILDLFLEKDIALSHQDIEAVTSGSFDRVTVYRTLQTFLEKGLIHTVPSSDNVVRYALCKDACAEGHHHDDHVHFVCDSCGATTCIDEVSIPPIRLPGGYRVRQIGMVVNGTCGRCG
ncbi:MAG: transcriptional repressor [Chitinophagia bacterium]|nr:transcriptional repressor [Chitinophagia bacterium]